MTASHFLWPLKKYRDANCDVSTNPVNLVNPV